MSREPDISKLLDEEIRKASNYFFPPKEQDDVLDKMKLVEAIADEVNSRIKDKHGAFFVFNGLLGLLAELSIEPHWANQIFNEIYSELKYQQRESKSDEDKFDGYKGLLFELKLIAVRYFKNQIYRELKDADLPKKLKLIKKTIAEIISHDDLFKREALVEIQKETETEIVLKKEEILHRQQIEVSKEIVGKKENLIKHENLNIESATLFFIYLFDFAKVNCSFSKKAETIEFLTRFSQKQIVKLPSFFEKQKLEIEDGSEINKKYFDDMQTARNYFQKLGLTEIVETIEKDLGN